MLPQAQTARGGAAVAGIEPASGRLTVAFPYQHENHRMTGSREQGVAKAGDYRLRTIPYSLFAIPSFKSAQRELNPHFRHGKAIGCRYIMGTTLDGEL